MKKKNSEPEVRYFFVSNHYLRMTSEYYYYYYYYICLEVDIIASCSS